MEQAAVVADDEIAGRPFMNIDEPAAGGMLEQQAQQPGAFTIRTGFQALDWTVNEIHLFFFTDVQRRAARVRVIAHQRMALWQLMRQKRLWRVAGPDIVRRSPDPAIGQARPVCNGIAISSQLFSIFASTCFKLSLLINLAPWFFSNAALDLNSYISIYEYKRELLRFQASDPTF